MPLNVRRTSLRAGAADAYRAAHSRIPETLATALRDAGVSRWSIWRDGDHLIHVIETVDGLSEMQHRMTALGPIETEWGSLIAELVHDAPECTVSAEPIWLLSPDGQFSGPEVELST